jgi:hypothetical protein
MNKRVLSPIVETKVINGRSYTGTPGTPQDILDVDARLLHGSGGWRAGMAGVGGQPLL